MLALNWNKKDVKGKTPMITFFKKKEFQNMCNILI